MAGNTILVVDGDLASRSYIATALQKEGYQVLQVASGKEGLISAWRDRPELLIIDPVLPDLQGEELATRLRADPRTAKVPLIALSSDPFPARLQSCSEAGFNEYHLKTSDVLPALLSSVAILLGRGATSAKEGGLLIVFLSAKGGTGTSSMCANFGMNIAEHQPTAQVVVADLVLPIGSIAGIVGQSDTPDLVALTRMSPAETTPEFLRKSLPRLDAWRFHLLAGSPDPERGNELVAARIAELVAALKASYDFVLLDLGRSLSRISLPLIEHADLIVMIVGSDLSTVTLTKTLWDYLQSKGVQPASMFMILNRAVGLEGVTKAEVERIVGIPVKTSVPYLGGNFSMANNQHQPYSVKFAGDTASIVLRDTAQQMVEVAKRVRAG